MPRKKKTNEENTLSTEQMRELDQLILMADEAVADREPTLFGVRTDEPEQELGERLQLAREHKGLTQAQLAELTKRADKEGKGLSRAVISLYEKNTNRPGTKEIRLLCEALRITPSYLIYGDDDPFEGYTEYGRFRGHARTEAEYYANMLYLFSKLHKHHSDAIMKIMQDLLMLWEKGFDKKMRKEAFPKFLAMADQLREELKARGE